jgi:carboxyl-terminal processing protease
MIRLVSFSATSPDKFREALREFANLSIGQGYNKLIIDLRNNPGGYLDAAVDIASWFLPLGDVVVTEDFGDKQKEEVYRSKGYDVFNENLKLAILVNGGSASAAEILAGALSQQGAAKLVGEKTFGKGSVQQLIDITDDTSLKVTVARWLLPDGTGITGKGIEPDYKVDITEKDVAAHKDPQLQKALQILNQ